MTERSDPTRTAGPKAAAVLERLAAQRRSSIVVNRDLTWLSEITSAPHELLRRMERAGLIYRVGRGRYVVAPRATFSARQAASAELTAAIMLDSQGDYYVGFLTALIAHRLTDLHSTTVYAAIRQSSRLSETAMQTPAGTIRLVRLAEGRWPHAPAELDRVRVAPGAKEFVWRSSLERTLVDCLARPELAAGMETVIGCWAGARRRDTDWDLVCAVARRYGVSMSRRTAFVLRLLGLHAIAERNLSDVRGRGARTLLDRSRGYAGTPRKPVRDASTGVVINVPVERLLGWAGAPGLP